MNVILIDIVGVCETCVCVWILSIAKDYLFFCISLRLRVWVITNKYCIGCVCKRRIAGGRPAGGSVGGGISFGSSGSVCSERAEGKTTNRGVGYGMFFFD